MRQQSGLESLPFDELHHDKGPAVVLTDFVNRADIGMIQCGGGARFPLESRNPDRIRQTLRQNPDRHFASEFLVLRPIHLSHAAFSEDREDLIVSERRAGLQHEQIELRI